MSIQNNFPAIKPTLLLDFANVEALDPRITYTRATTATYYDGKTVALAEQNLLIRSQEFDNAAWSKTNLTVTANTQVAPDGTTTADTLTDNITLGSHSFNNSGNAFTSALNTFSIYAKAGTANFVGLSRAAADFYAVFDLSGGTVSASAGCTASIVNAGNGWYRCILASPTINSQFFQVNIGLTATQATVGNTYIGIGSTVHVWGAQVENRSAPTAYTPTTTAPITNYIPVLQTAAAGVARFDHNPTTGESLGLLIEEQRTNLQTRSSDASYWCTSNSGASFALNQYVAPDTTLTADQVVTTGTGSFFGQYGSGDLWGTLSSNGTVAYTGSIYLKDYGGNASSVSIQINAYSGTVTGVFNLVAGTATNGTIQAVGNGWYRCSVTSGLSTSALGTYRITTGGAYTLGVWGLQFEAGSFATSYIPTVASQITRANDAASMTGANFSSWYNQANGSLVMEWVEVFNSSAFIGNGGGVSLNANGTATPCFEIIPRNADVVATARGAGGGATSSIASSALTRNAGTSYKAAMAFSQNPLGNVADFSINGAVLASNTSVTSNAMFGINQLDIGKQVTSGTTIGTRCFKRVAYYPSKFTAIQLQALTS